MLAIRRASSYIPAMGFWKDVSPKAAFSDFRGEWGNNPYRWRVLAVSIAATAGVMILAIPPDERVEPRPLPVTYITTFEDGRTKAEILASNLANQKRKEERQALLEKREELRKSLYRELGRATGLDVDAMEKEIAEQEAAEEAERQEQLDALQARREAQAETTRQQ